MGCVKRKAIIALLASVTFAADAAAQERISFRSELPRTLVFVQEIGGGGTATAEVSQFLQEAGFPLVEPSFASTPEQRELIARAVTGDGSAAVQLGRDFGAHVLILGNAEWGTAANPLDERTLVGTSKVSLRAIRLDAGEVLSTQSAEGVASQLTEQAARSKAIEQAITELMGETDLIGRMANSWTEQPWSTRGYFTPDPGSLEAALSAPITAGAPRLAIIRTDVLPAASATATTRGIGVVSRSRGKSDGQNDLDVQGVVVGQVQQVQVEGQPARLEPMSAESRSELGLTPDAQWFKARVTLPLSQDTIHVAARSVTGEIATATAAARIGQRYAVVVGVSEYADANIRDLRYAARDAEAFRDFLLTDAAGPFPEENILFLKDGAATAQALRDAMFVFLQKAEFNDLVVIYFAGHGAPDPSMPENLYLLPTDADPRAFASTAFPMWDVKTALRRQIRAERVVVIADACHSGGTQQGADNRIGGAFAELFDPSRRLTLTAAAENELSHEDAKWGGGHGVFTHNILEALRGAGDADGNGIVTFDEMSSYVSTRVAAETNARQNPQRSGIGDVPLSIAAPRQ